MICPQTWTIVPLRSATLRNARCSNCKKGFKPVVIDGNTITANGPATAIPFALAIVAQGISEEKAREVAEGMLVYNPQQDYCF